MRQGILIFLLLINIVSIIQLGQYESGELIALMSVRIILSVITIMLSIAYILVRGSKSLIILSVITALSAFIQLALIVYINL
ncbi:hypothetical protein J4760_10405 [Salinicoccus sp. ID82-1]|uniref:Uncharacterized protein n=1 Tax=Salinicoccus cyprini TaxID=2493691 RepID=A0A558AVA2_9STAP|nr:MULTISPECIES: hypothetical protein [Salinicoccus]MCG1010430.1 hypothetical protein [Salinicoccus sp. ID82-1]TVT28194.1 hypothetical protein FO441_07215 [Salinicoccus cyprini]